MVAFIGAGSRPDLQPLGRRPHRSPNWAIFARRCRANSLAKARSLLNLLMRTEYAPQNVAGSVFIGEAAPRVLGWNRVLLASITALSQAEPEGRLVDLGALERRGIDGGGSLQPKSSARAGDVVLVKLRRRGAGLGPVIPRASRQEQQSD